MEGTGSPGEAGTGVRPDVSLIAAAVEQCARAFDDDNGGLRTAHKFPSSVPIRLLLRHHQRTGDTHALRMAVRTLEAMAAGGIYDHVAGGFHRYATDPMWRVPHFEKMLYDNALLVVAFAEAWQVTKRAVFARVVRETCDELLATFASPDGGFYSATDADSEGEEGKYFVWDEQEIRTILGSGEDTELFLRHYGVTKDGNFERSSILYQARPDEEVTQRLAPARAALSTVRKQRVPPLRDDKILAAWNGLTISALAVAGRVLGEKRYLDAAVRAADFLCVRMREPKKGRLARSFCDGQLGVDGFLDDHAFAAAGMLDLLESTGEPRWFDEACRLAEETQGLFAAPEGGGWFMSSQTHERLLARERPAFDGAEPAGSSVALMNLARLAAFTDGERWRRAVDHALAACLPRMQEHPLAMTEALLAVDFVLGPVREIALALPHKHCPNEPAFRKALADTFSPRKVLVAGIPTSTDWKSLASHMPWLDGKTTHPDKITGYVCSEGQCQLPTTEPELFHQQLIG
jgi:uncharacterized protein YyaL (SSP411 family)